MNKIKILLISLGSAVGTLLASLAGATTYTTSTVASETAPILNETVQAGLSVFISFLTNNWPLIATVGIAVGLVFFLYYKFKGALRGR